MVVRHVIVPQAQSGTLPAAHLQPVIHLLGIRLGDAAYTQTSAPLTESWESFGPFGVIQAPPS
jgi:hypothetical protein